MIRPEISELLSDLRGYLHDNSSYGLGQIEKLEDRIRALENFCERLLASMEKEARE